MKKKLLLSIPIFAVTAATSIIGYADSGTTTYDSQGHLGFYSGTGITPPVDPNIPNPNLPVNPQNPDGSKPLPGTNGPLSIDFASSFDFGINPISNKDQVYSAKAQEYFDSEDKTPNYIQVTDNRGDLSGWTLRVVENGQLRAKDPVKYPVLKGATLSLSNSKAASNGNAEAPKTQDVMDLVPETESVIASASVGAGAGTWVIRWGEQDELKVSGDKVISPDVQLFVPGTTGKDATSYVTTLTWTLSSLPID